MVVREKFLKILESYQGEFLRILSGRISGKLPGKPEEMREKISDDLVWTL